MEIRLVLSGETECEEHEQSREREMTPISQRNFGLTCGGDLGGEAGVAGGSPGLAPRSACWNRLRYARPDGDRRHSVELRGHNDADPMMVMTVDEA